MQRVLPKSGSGGEGVLCEGVGYIGNPVTWVEVEQLRVAIITCRAYTALSLGDYIPAQHYAEEILSQYQAPQHSLPGCYQLLAHLYTAESLILQDRLVEAMVPLDPNTVSLGTAGSQSVGWPHAEAQLLRALLQLDEEEPGQVCELKLLLNDYTCLGGHGGGARGG